MIPLVNTGEAAEAVGVDRRTLQRWWRAGDVVPTIVTPGGHARWDVDDLKAQLKGPPPTQDPQT